MELTYINALGERLTLRQSRPFFLTKIDGTGKIHQTVNTFKAPEQDGAFFISSTLDMRNITLEGTVVANTPDEVYTLRKKLLRIFTPKQQGTFLYRDRQIACVVEEAGFVATGRERAPGFFISLLCPSPFFETPEEVRAELALWLKLFQFGLEIPQSGIEFGARQPSQIITVDNIGDVACGCQIVFKALGSVVNPELMNMDTGEVVRLLTTMQGGEELRVYTHFAGKRVVAVQNQIERNAFSLLDTGSTFLQLEASRNVLRYGAADNMDLLEVSIFYRPRFLGV
ncbi:tail protein [Clostridia bacterium]|nr:tail protein [Clostridia bacterium]